MCDAQVGLSHDYGHGGACIRYRTGGEQTLEQRGDCTGQGVILQMLLQR